MEHTELCRAIIGVLGSTALTCLSHTKFHSLCAGHRALEGISREGNPGSSGGFVSPKMGFIASPVTCRAHPGCFATLGCGDGPGHQHRDCHGHCPPVVVGCDIQAQVAFLGLCVCRIVWGFTEHLFLLWSEGILAWMEL